MSRFDIDADGKIAALDALRIIHALSRPVVAEAADNYAPLAASNLSCFRFFDVNRDNK
jgi:hypothetical protein